MSKKNDENQILETVRLTSSELADEFRSLRKALTQKGQFSLSIYHRDGIETVPLSEGKSVVIGRSDPADVSIRDSSLSRQHAAVELKNGEVWVSDLQSTNGTRINGEPIETSKVGEGDELTFGAVAASVHKLDARTEGGLGFENHDRFRGVLEVEVVRAREFGRSLALFMVASERSEELPVSRWFPKVQERLRQFDHIALYSPFAVEILRPETSVFEAEKFASRLVKIHESLRVGIGVHPDHAVSHEELMENTGEALRHASREHPTRTATPASLRATAIGLEAGGDGPVVASDAMKEVYRNASRLASSVIPVLLLGETGTGKEVVARAIHQGGPRKELPMNCVNCGAIPPQLVESTLFGHEKGAFTGANQQSKGVFESAHGGTVFLDEIGELPFAAQAALLRVLETSRFKRVGSNKELEVDVRIIAATHQDLEAMCTKGDFREDLLYRLNAMTLAIPPLRKRVDEIEPLAWYFLEQANKSNGCSVRIIDDDVMRRLKTYSWPGNVRELKNAVARAAVIADNHRISLDDLPERIRDMGGVDSPADQERGVDKGDGLADAAEINLKAEVNRYEAALILKALQKADWDRSGAAKRLGLPVRTLAYKIQQHGLKK